jgi:hypothetical protein
MQWGAPEEVEIRKTGLVDPELALLSVYYGISVELSVAERHFGSVMALH